ncbi:MAG: hypothetical protein ACI8UG_000706 [Gammaproteobacteria bacterium]|jgi:hypothetical protein
MNSLTIVTVLSVLAILLPSTAAATYYYDTQDIQQRVIAEAKRQNMPPSLALAIAKVESNFDHQALSHAGAKGVMQIMPRTAEQVFGVSRSRLFEPDVNIQLGVKFIKKLLKRYDDRLDIALSHYNGGSGVKNRHGELSVMPSTRDYVDKVLAAQQDFLQHDFLQNDNRTLFASRANQSGIQYVDGNTAKFQVDTEAFDTRTQNPQIETLRALRLHNITRNYQGKVAVSFNEKPVHFAKLPSVQVTLNTKIAKVRLWESIYPD